MLPAQAKEYIDEVRKNYANPVSATTWADYLTDAYCVLGAVNRVLNKNTVLKETQMISHFPGWTVGVEILQALNPDLTDEVARTFYKVITLYNDSNKFEEAWQEVEKALMFPYKEVTNESNEDINREASRELREVCCGTV